MNHKKLTLIFLFLMSGCNDGDYKSLQESAVVNISTLPEGKGLINPTNISINSGDSATFHIIPEKSHFIESVTGCNGNLNNLFYQIKPKESCTIEVNFQPIVRRNVKDLFSRKYFNSTGYEVTYDLYEPTIEPGENYPLILALHGTSEGGAARAGYDRPHLEDKLGELIGRPVATAWVQEPYATNYPAYVAAPLIMLPSEKDDHWYDRFMFERFIELINDLIDHYPIDPNRIYLVGHSAGGMAAWSLPSLENSKFAAILPMSGWYSNDEPIEKTIKNAYPYLSVWAFGNIKDADTPISAMRNIRAKLIREKFDVKVFDQLNSDQNRIRAFSVLQQPNRYINSELKNQCTSPAGDCHFSGIDVAATEPLLYEWLFRQHRLSKNQFKQILWSRAGKKITISWELNKPRPNEKIKIWIKNKQDWDLLISDDTSKKKATIEASIDDKLLLQISNKKGFVYAEKLLDLNEIK